MNHALVFASFALSMASVGLIFSDFAAAFVQPSLNEHYLSLTLVSLP